ncbi:hypothetical protein ACH4VX_33730 [Streptomyces sp. NPDC020731]
MCEQRVDEEPPLIPARTGEDIREQIIVTIVGVADGRTGVAGTVA